MKTFRCDSVSVVTNYGDHRLRCRMIDNHDMYGGKGGEYTITSVLKMVDFERKIAITQNNIYKWED